MSSSGNVSYGELLMAFRNLKRYSHNYNENEIPRNGIYVFYQDRESIRISNKNYDRIVRVGINRDNGNFQDRLHNHFKSNSLKGTIFRRHLANAFINRDFKNQSIGSLSDGVRNKIIENMGLVIETVSFSFIEISEKRVREKFEKGIIATIAQSSLNHPSMKWIGNNHPNSKIKESGLFNIHYLNHNALTIDELNELKSFI
jgi:hypothetical protein